jgi:hypothetical protein
MKKTALLLGGIILTTATSVALAQAPEPAPPSPINPPPAGNAAVPAIGDAPEQNPYTVANIDRAAPFGEINVEMATNPDTLAAWQKTLSDDQATELDQRCEVITAATDFPAEPRAFCDMWLIVRAGEMGDPAAAPLQEAAPGGGVTQVQPPGAGGLAPAKTVKP